MAFLGCSPPSNNQRSPPFNHHDLEFQLETKRAVAGGSPKKSHPSMANVSTQILGKERHIVVVPKKR
jgi:hypothetical protein